MSILKEADAGRPVNEIWRHYAIRSARYYKLKAKYGGLGVSNVKWLKELEYENGCLKRMCADLSLENSVLKDVIAKTTLRPAERREVVTHLITVSGLLVEWVCRVVGRGGTTYYQPPVDWARRDVPVIAALNTPVAAKSRWGFWKCCDRLRLNGHSWNPNRLWGVTSELDKLVVRVFS